MPVKGQVLPIEDRIDNKFHRDCTTGCLIWTASRSSQRGYPTISLPGTHTPVYAYRWAWEQERGPIPTGPCPDGSHRYEIHHRCGDNRCINVDHLRLVTAREHRRIHAERRAFLRICQDVLDRARPKPLPPLPPPAAAVVPAAA